MKVKLLFAQPTLIVTVVDWPGESVPLDGLNCAALLSLEADHLRLPGELLSSDRVALHCQTVVSDVQLFVSKLVGLAISIGGGGVQLHDEVMDFVPPDPEKVKVAAWQAIEEMVTSTDPPGDKVPFGGLKLTPDKLLLADQVISLWEPALSVIVSVHVQLLPSPVQEELDCVKSSGLTVKVGGNAQCQ